MDPYMEQRLRDEVLYLHSLWHQGPTRTTADHLQPTNSTHFKKPGKTSRGKWAGKPLSNNISSGIEWPVDPPSDSPPRNASGWPELKLKPNPTVKLPTPEELARYNWNHVQQKALKATEDFFSSNADSDGEAVDSDEEDDVMEDDDMEDGRECESEFKFFLNLLTGDGELRSYFEKNYGGGGEFCCLVCGGAGKKFGKRFKDCVALIQHSVTIAKTTKRRAHRAYGQAMCKVLGWQIDQLPSITSNLKSTESQVIAADQVSNAVTNNVALANIGNNGAGSGMDSNPCESLPSNLPALSNAMDGEMMVCEVADAVISTTVPDKQVVNEAEGNAEGVVTSLEPLKEDGVGSGRGNEVGDIGTNYVTLDGSVKENALN